MLAAAASGSAHEGNWLIADVQSAGRGRMGRAWMSPPGNLYASGLVTLRPDDPAAPTLAFVAALAAYDALSPLIPHGGLVLKWPNDLLAGGAKIAGILLERASDAVVIGIGINLAHHPQNLERPVTSLAALGIAPPAPPAFLERLADIFAQWLARWRIEGLAPTRAAWLERAHPIGTALSAALPDGSRVDGLFDGLTSDCALQLRLPDGAIRAIHAGDVFLI